MRLVPFSLCVRSAFGAPASPSHERKSLSVGTGLFPSRFADHCSQVSTLKPGAASRPDAQAAPHQLLHAARSPACFARRLARSQWPPCPVPHAFPAPRRRRFGPFLSPIRLASSYRSRRSFVIGFPQLQPLPMAKELLLFFLPAYPASFPSTRSCFLFFGCSGTFAQGQQFRPAVAHSFMIVPHDLESATRPPGR